MKIKVKKQIAHKLYEEEAAASMATPMADSKVDRNSLDNSNATGADDLGQQIISELRKGNVKDNLKVTFDIPQALFGDLPFPDANPNMKTLLSDLGYSAKWKNMRGIVPDPVTTINKTPDMANYAFADVEFDLETPKSIIQSGKYALPSDGEETAEEHTDETADAETETADAPAPEEESEISLDGAVDDEGEGVSESRALAHLDPLNEFLGDHFFNGLFTRNRDIEKSEKKADVTTSTSNQKNANAAIDTYITSLSRVTVDLLKIIADKSQYQEIANLGKRISELKTHTVKQINDYIKAKDEILTTVEDKEDRKELQREKLANFLSQNQLKFANGYMNVARVNNKMNNDTMAIIGRIMTAKSDKALQNAIEDAEQKIGKFDDDQIKGVPGATNETMTYTKFKRMHKLNEADDNASSGSDNGIELFVGDQSLEDYYKYVHEEIGKIIESVITATDQMSMPDYVDAKTKMEALKKTAADGIAERIKVVCRMDGNQLGLGGKISSFMLKHPLRADKLTLLWKQHEADLDERMKDKLDIIANNAGALGYCTAIARETIPELFARMFVYKAIITALTNQKIYKTTNKVAIGQDTEEAIKEQRMQFLMFAYKTMFSEKGSYLTLDGKEFIDESGNTIVNNYIPYLGVLINNIIELSKHDKMMTINQDNFATFRNCVETIKSNVSNPEDFITNFIKLIVGNYSDLSSIMLMTNGTQTIADCFSNEDIKTKVKDCYESYKKMMDGADSSKLAWALAIILADNSIINKDEITPDADDAAVAGIIKTPAHSFVTTAKKAISHFAINEGDDYMVKLYDIFIAIGGSKMFKDDENEKATDISSQIDLLKKIFEKMACPVMQKVEEGTMKQSDFIKFIQDIKDFESDGNVDNFLFNAYNEHIGKDGITINGAKGKDGKPVVVQTDAVNEEVKDQFTDYMNAETKKFNQDNYKTILNAMMNGNDETKNDADKITDLKSFVQSLGVADSNGPIDHIQDFVDSDFKFTFEDTENFEKHFMSLKMIVKAYLYAALQAYASDPENTQLDDFKLVWQSLRVIKLAADDAYKSLDIDIESGKQRDDTLDDHKLDESLVEALMNLYNAALYGPTESYRDKLKEILEKTSMADIIALYGDRKTALEEFGKIVNDFADAKWTQSREDICTFLGI